jgi:acetylglutamate synthase
MIRKRRLMPIDMNGHEFIDEQNFRMAARANEDIINEDVKVKPFIGKYERYFFDEDKKKIIIKEILSINTNGSVTIRSTRGILKGTATYFMNSALSIIITLLNEEPYNEHLLGYVGRYDYASIDHVSVICSAINIKNIPIARTELLIPCGQATNFPELIEIDSQTFYKLNYKYPQLHKALQARGIKGGSEVTW